MTEITRQEARARAMSPAYVLDRCEAVPAIIGDHSNLLIVSGLAGTSKDIAALTDDGAHIYVQYGGLLEFNEKVQGAFASGTGTEYGDAYFMTQPRFETGDERYAWLNQLVAVGQGRLLPGGVAYDVYACMND